MCAVKSLDGFLRLAVEWLVEGLDQQQFAVAVDSQPRVALGCAVIEAIGVGLLGLQAGQQIGPGIECAGKTEAKGVGTHGFPVVETRVRASQTTQCPQAERARRSWPSQGPPTHRPAMVSLSMATVPGRSPGARGPDQR